MFNRYLLACYNEISLLPINFIAIKKNYLKETFFPLGNPSYDIKII
jgi:hypothetical protein